MFKPIRGTMLIATGALILMACSEQPRPVIRVGIGMTLKELISDSSYPFAHGLSSKGVASDCSKAQGLSEHWNITEPYDLVYVHGKDELVSRDLGGQNFLLAITTSPSSCRVDAIRVTFQNHEFSVDEALAAATRLTQWLFRAGFRRPTDEERRQGHFAELFAVEQASGAPRHTEAIASLADVRAALVDQHSKIKKVVLAQLISSDAGADIWVENARRTSEDITGTNNEGETVSEKEYFIYLDISTADFRRR